MSTLAELDEPSPPQRAPRLAGLPRMPRRVAALLEQAAVSGANFLALLVFARHLVPEALGAFGMAWAVALFLQGLQRALVTIPMVPFSAGHGGWWRGRRAWAGANSALALGGLVVLVLAALLALGVPAAAWWAGVLAMASVLLLPMWVHEFARRAAVQEQRWGLLAAMGLAYAAVLLASAWALVVAAGPGGWAALPAGAAGSMALPAVSAGSAGSPAWLAAWPALGMALASAAAALLYRIVTGHAVLLRPCAPPPHAGYASFGRWAVASHLGYSGYNFGVQALLAALGGAAAVGAWHACRALVQPVSTLQAAMDSIDKPQAAAALVAHGVAAMRRLLLRTLLRVAALALPFLAALAWAAEPVLQLLYGDRYAGMAEVVSMACLAALCSVVSQPVESGLYVLGRTRALFAARCLAAMAGLGAAWLWIPAHGAAGALAAVATGFAVAALGGAAVLATARERES